MQAKAKRGHHYQTSCTRNVKGISLSGKEKTRTRNMKIIKGKTSPPATKYKETIRD